MSEDTKKNCTAECANCKNYQPAEPRKVEVGWVCPRCGRGIAPKESSCPFCGPNYYWNITTSPWWTQPYYTTTTASNTITKDSITLDASDPSAFSNTIQVNTHT